MEQPELLSSKEKCHFLLDSVGVVTDCTNPKHEGFKSLLVFASQYEPMLALCATALDRPDVLADIQESLKVEKAKESDNITFKVAEVYPVELSTWAQWWSEYRALIGSPGETKTKMRCLLTGELVTPKKTHSKIGGMSSVGGQPSGTALISFDKEAFCSYGLKQSENAACGANAVAAYTAALDRLVSNASAPVAGSKFIHWFKEPITEEEDIINLYDEGEELSEGEQKVAAAQVDEIIHAMNNGQRPHLLQNRYYAIQLSGSGGRIMVRNWMEGDYLSLAKNLQKWFDDIKITAPEGKHEVRQFKLKAALMRLVSYRKNEVIKKTFERIDKELSSLTPLIYRAILQGNPVPDSVAAKALTYIRSSVYSSDGGKNLDQIACSLLKMWLIRKKGDDQAMGSKVNENIPIPLYHAGRLLAVLSDLQHLALGDVGSNVVSIYYSSASSVPALTIGRLMSLAQHHLAKIEKTKKGAAVNYEKKIAEIMVSIGTNLPTLVDLEGKTYFSLGFYQQKAQIFADARAAKEAKNKSEDK